MSFSNTFFSGVFIVYFCIYITVVLGFIIVRLFAGLNDEKVQVFVGATVGRPIIDEKSKTATYHCIDFLGVLMDRTVEDISGQANCRSDTALSIDR